MEETQLMLLSYFFLSYKRLWTSLYEQGQFFHW